jgi:hypothetical protein
MRFASLIDKQLHPHAWYMLGLSQGQRWCVAVGAPVVALRFFYAEVGLDADLSPLVVALMGYALIALAVAAFMIPDRCVRWYRTRWVDALELPLDRESYARALDGQSRYNGIGRYARLRVIVHGGRMRIPEITGVVAHVELHPRGLVFESFTMQVAGGFRQHGIELHRWFVLLTKHVLRPLAREQVIEGVSVEYVDCRSLI